MDAATMDQAVLEQFHTFGVDDLFFSTTDLKGIIEKSNSVFEQISHYSHDELVGAPHNIIRHEDMPGGAFKLVWDQIEAGHPAGAYVKNLAKDGKSYWVLATLMPVGDKYLSVRLRPSVESLRDLCYGLYLTVVAEERRLRAEGMSRAAAAEAGAAIIAEELGKLGISGMTGLMATLLPAEMAARSSETLGIPVRAYAEGPLREILEAARRLSSATDRQISELEPYAQLAEQVKDAAEAIRTMLRRLHQLSGDAGVAAQKVSTQSRVLVNTAGGLTEMARRADRSITEARVALDSARDRLTRTRTRIALSRLHIDMVGNFTAEIIDGTQPPGAHDAIELLCQALSEGGTQMAVDVQALPVELREVARLTSAATEAIGTFRRWAIQFRNLITREGLWEELGHLTPPMDELLNSAFVPLGDLARTTAHCRSAGAPFDPQAVYTDLAVIRGALRTLPQQVRTQAAVPQQAEQAQPERPQPEQAQPEEIPSAAQSQLPKAGPKIPALTEQETSVLERLLAGRQEF